MDIVDYTDVPVSFLLSGSNERRKNNNRGRTFKSLSRISPTCRYVFPEDNRMEAIKFRVIESETEIEKYIEKIESQTGVRLPPLYVHSSKIVGGFLQNKLVAGYMLVTKPSFRSLLLVHDSIKAAHSFLVTISTK
jgi:UDP-N-acetylglucosamine pyrophosphorylase